METTDQNKLDETIVFLKTWLSKTASKESLEWLEKQQKQIFEGKSNSLYFMTFSSLATYFNKDIPPLSSEQVKQVESIRKNWHPVGWSSAQIARTYLILNYAKHRPEAFKETIDKIFAAADIQELITLYQALPLFPDPKKFLLHATNGIRSNMMSVFDAIALNNPYPADFFDEIAWNQLVLKTLFVESNIKKVIGLKRRANPTLAHALMNTVRERFAAERTIKPEMWYLIGLNTDASTLPELKKFLQDKNTSLQDGAIIALNQSQLPEAKTLLKEFAPSNQKLQADLQKLRSFEQDLIN